MPLAGNDQASTIHTALANLESSSDDGDAATGPVGSIAAQAAADAERNAALRAPAEQEKGGVPHRWKVVSMMALSFVLCNMDKVR
jgi:hypothetical protein